MITFDTRASFFSPRVPPMSSPLPLSFKVLFCRHGVCHFRRLQHMRAQAETVGQALCLIDAHCLRLFPA